jgi:hypothetical protein
MKVFASFYKKKRLPCLDCAGPLRKRFFFSKKNQKTSIPLARAGGVQAPP